MVQISKHLYGILNEEAAQHIGAVTHKFQFWHSHYYYNWSEAAVERFAVRRFVKYPTYNAPIEIGRKGFEIFVVLEEEILIGKDDFLAWMHSCCDFVAPLEFETPLFKLKIPSPSTMSWKLSEIESQWIESSNKSSETVISF